MELSHYNGAFNIDMQKVLLACLLADYSTFKKCKPHLNQHLFDDQLRRGVRFIIAHETEYQTLPAASLVKAKTGIEIQTPAELGIDLDQQWFLPEFERFARHRTMENVILDAYDTLERGEYQEVTDQINAAMKISLSGRKHKFDRLPLLDRLAAPQPKWLFKGLCYERSVGVIFGESETFKSFIILALSYMLVFGRKWRGRNLNQRNVIYVAGEGAEMLALRQLAWLKHHDLPIQNDGLHVVPAAINLLNPHEVADFLIRMKEYETLDALLALDTLSTMIAGKDENTAEVMSQVVEVAKYIARELGCTVLLVHHTGKDVSRHARGNYALHANIDFEWEVTKVNEWVSKVHVTKQKDGPKPTFFFRAHKVKLGLFDDDGDERDSLAMVQTDEIEVECDTPGSTVTTQEADRSNIAAVMDIGQSLSRGQLARLVMTVLGIQERATERRIDLALPVDLPCHVQRGDDQVVLIRSKGERGYLVKMMASPSHVVPKTGNTGIADIA